MSKVVQVSILGKISGNVNADETIGNRATIKKMYSSDGEVFPFVSARAIKFAIRQAFKENFKDFKIDPFREDPKATQQLRLMDSGDPFQFIDNDLFGYMMTKGRTQGQPGEAYKRYSPVAISYFKALRDTPIKSEFAARFPRDSEKGKSDPVPFEVEVADFIGKLNILIYDYVGNFTKSTKLNQEISRKHKELQLTRDEKYKRLSAFLEIILTPSYVLPRRTNSLNIPEYYCALICFSEKGPLPIYQYLEYFKVDKKSVLIDITQLNKLVSRKEIMNKDVKFFLIDYNSSIPYEGEHKLDDRIKTKEIPDVIEGACKFLFSE
jgi:CRISPR-associated protein Cst2